MKKFSFGIVLTICFISTPLFCETIRLPAHYIVTTSDVHNLTGLESNVRTTHKLEISPLDVTKVIDNGNSLLRISALKGEGIDNSEESYGFITFDEKDALLAILESLPQTINRPVRKPVDSSETLFDHGDINLTLISESKYNKVYADFTVGTRTYVLQSTGDVEKLTNAIKSIY